MVSGLTKAVGIQRLGGVRTTKLQELGWGSSLVVQPVKDLLLPQLWCGFDPWLGNLHILWAWPKKKERIEEEENRLGDRRKGGVVEAL